jgi:hypothetical protein
MLFIGQEERESDDGSGVATEDDDGADAEAGENARDFLEVTLSQLWEGRFGRRTAMTTKMMETSRDDSSAGGPMEDKACPTVSLLLSLLLSSSSSSSSSSLSDGASTATMERGIHW